MRAMISLFLLSALAAGCGSPNQARTTAPDLGDQTVKDSVLGPVDPAKDGQLDQILDDKLGPGEADTDADGAGGHVDCHESCCPPELLIPDPDGMIECCLCDRNSDDQ